MPPSEPRERRNIDWRLVVEGCVHLFWSVDVLEDTARWLSENGYRVMTLEAESWQTEADALDAIGRAFACPEPDPDLYPLDELSLCLRDFALDGFVSDESSNGTTLVLMRYDRYARRQPLFSHQLLDTFAWCSRTALLRDHRMLCLVQSDDPEIRFDPVGATAVAWNDKEMRPASRRA